MSRSVSVAVLETRIRQAADIENDDHVTSEEILSLLNTHYPDFWDLLIESGPPHLLDDSFTFTTSAATQSYDLEVQCPDANFYKLTGLFLVVSDGTNYPIHRFQDTQAQAWQPNESAGKTIKVNYTPSCPVLTAASSINGFNGWEELLVQRIASEIAKKRKEDNSRFEEGYARVKARILKMANPDRWQAQTVLRRKNRPWHSLYLSADGPNAYVLRGTSVELVNLRYWGV